LHRFLRAVNNVACRLNFERLNKLGTETEKNCVPLTGPEALELWVAPHGSVGALPPAHEVSRTSLSRLGHHPGKKPARFGFGFWVPKALFFPTFLASLPFQSRRSWHRLF